MYVKRFTDELSSNYSSLKKNLRSRYSAFVSLALFIRHALQMCRLLLVSLASLDLPYFTTLCH
jgi:hypothetical protein